MTLTTQYVPGAPDWLDLGTPDMAAAASFYGELFGWQLEALGSEAGGYAMFQLGGKRVAGLGPLTEEGARWGHLPAVAGGAWTVYFHTADADATAKAVQQAGGTVRFGPMEVFTEGRMASFTDPAGAPFAVWEPRDNPGLELVTQPGSLCWTELHTPEPDGARSFYGTVFGWRSDEVPFAGTTYTVLSLAEDRPEPALGGIMPLPPAGAAAHWLPYIEVSDCDLVAAKAEQSGGAIAIHPVEAADVGRFARLTDPFGADFAVITSARRPEAA